MKLNRLTKTLRVVATLALLIPMGSHAITTPADDDDILDMIMPILASIKQSISVPMPTGNAFSLPYGFGDAQTGGAVKCPNRTLAPNGDVSQCTNISAAAIQLQNFISGSYRNAPACNVPINGNNKFYPSIQYPGNPLKVIPGPDACGYNDMTLFNGLICAGDVYKYGWSAASSIGCQAVKDSQDATGKMWRSPYRKINKGLGDPNSFSPDMDLGVMLYAAVTKDTTRLVNWWNWIDKNTPCALPKTELVCTHQHLVTAETTACDTWDGNILQYPPFGKCTHTHVVTPATYACDTYAKQTSCLIRNLPRYCETENCTIRPQDIKMMREVASYLNLTLPSQLANYNTTFNTLTNAGLQLGLLAQLINNNVDIYTWINLSSQASKTGFSLHLEGVRIFTLRLMGRGNADENSRLDSAAQTLVNRQPENLFFHYLNDGGPIKPASLATKNMFYKKCSSYNAADNRDQWAWQSEDAEQRWLQNSLWDCRFMAQVLYSK